MTIVHYHVQVIGIKIGLNVRECLGTGKGGIGRYTRNLIDNMFRLDNENEYALFSEDNPVLDEFPDVARFDVKTKPSVRRLIWDHLKMPRALKEGDFDLVHCFKFVVPEMETVKTVLTVYDILFLLHPQHFTSTTRMYWQRAVPRAVGCADAVIAISETTRQDLIQHLGVDPEKVHYIPLGVESRFNPGHRGTAQSKEVLERMGIMDDYILYVGTLEPRKNVTGLLRAYQKGFAELGGKKLVIAGKKGWDYQPIFTAVELLNIQKHVRFLDLVDDSVLPILYANADLFVYPSLYEGFGLPPLEAMASGVPVVTGDHGALTEVVGESGWCVSPSDTSALRDAMVEAILDMEQVKKKTAAGLSIAREYTWERTARETLEVYSRLVA